MNIPKKGVDACLRDPKDPTKLLSIQMEQHRADGKVGKQISWTSRVVDKDNDDSMKTKYHPMMKFVLVMKTSHQRHQKAM